MRDVVVDLGVCEAWTPTLGSDEDFDCWTRGGRGCASPIRCPREEVGASRDDGHGPAARVGPQPRARRPVTCCSARSATCSLHPDAPSAPRVDRGRSGRLARHCRCPQENERLTVVLGRRATTRRPRWRSGRRWPSGWGSPTWSCDRVPKPRAGWHPTRLRELVDATSGAVLGLVGEADTVLVGEARHRPRVGGLGLLDVDFDALGRPERGRRGAPRSSLVPSRFPSAGVDLAFVTPRCRARPRTSRRRCARRRELVESVELFDVYAGREPSPAHAQPRPSASLQLPETRPSARADVADRATRSSTPRRRPRARRLR